MAAVQVFYTTVLAFTLGVALRTVLAVPLAFAGLLVVIGAALLVIIRRYGASPALLLICAAGVGFSLGVVRTDYAWSQLGVSPLVAAVGNKITLEGVVAREPERREQSLHVYIKMGDNLILVTTDRYEAIAFGDRVLVTGQLLVPESFTTDLGRTFNYPGYLRARGVEYRMSFPDEVVVLNSAQGNTVLAGLYSFKETFISALARVLPEPALGLGVGLLLGVKQSLGEEIEDAFRTTGIIHIVVLSGYNLALVVTFVTVLLSFLLTPRPRVVLALLALALFTLLVGLSATVVRAATMAALALIAQAFGRGYIILRGLLFAGVLMLVWNPWLLMYDIGFQFSFLATLGLILVAPQLETLFVEGKWMMSSRQFFIATLAAQVAVTPLLLYHIGEVSLIALLVNVLVLPAVPFAMMLTFITGVAALVVPAVATVSAYPTTLVLTYIIETAQLFATVPYAAVPVPQFSFGWVIVAYAVLGYVVYRFTRIEKTDITAEDTKQYSDWVIEEESAVVARVEKRKAAV
ncbi:ComEC family competence protein [Patescibacteria group bacterium]|nr:ComEC family competence protein [Patescibacteria group bacterium]